MKTNEIIAGLRRLCGQGTEYRRTVCRLAADTLETHQARIAELEAELKDERHRHDRYVDFELAEAAELAQLKAERRWIPVTERLPEEHKSVVPGLGTVSKPVLVTWVDPFSKNAYPDNSFVREGITRNGEFTLKHINGDLVPVAWMYQPKPYEPPEEGA